MDLEIIDSRLFTVLVTGNHINSLGIKDLYKRIFNYKYVNVKGSKVVVFDQESIDEKSKVGRIRIERGMFNRTWLRYPVEFLRGDGYALFALRKILWTPQSKIKIQNTEAYFDGISPNDERRYLRFSDSNRMQLSKESYERSLEE